MMMTKQEYTFYKDGLRSDCDRLWKEYSESGTPEQAWEILVKIDEKRIHLENLEKEMDQ